MFTFKNSKELWNIKMRMIIFLIKLSFIALFVFTNSIYAQDGPPVIDADFIKQGKELYNQKCVTCHGESVSDIFQFIQLNDHYCSGDEECAWKSSVYTYYALKKKSVPDSESNQDTSVSETSTENDEIEYFGCFINTILR
jgi:hypothetical protein